MSFADTNTSSFQAGLLLTALTLLFGTNPGGIGPRLWLGCCDVYFQPSEPLKLLLITYLAAYFADKLPSRLRIIHLLYPTLILSGIVIMLLLAQRDLGTASIFIALYTIIIYLATGRKRVLLVSAVLLLVVSAAGYYGVSIIHTRIDSWLNPWNDPGGSSYQIIQSMIAIANGGIEGRGPGLGSPGFVPVAVFRFYLHGDCGRNGSFRDFGPARPLQPDPRSRLSHRTPRTRYFPPLRCGWYYNLLRRSNNIDRWRQPASPAVDGCYASICFLWRLVIIDILYRVAVSAHHQQPPG